MERTLFFKTSLSMLSDGGYAFRENLIYGIILLSLAFSISFFLTPFVQKFGLKKKLIDGISTRKQKEVSLVRVGGLGIYGSYLISSIFLWNFFREIDISFFLLVNIIGFFYFVIGLIDDLKSLSPFIRLFGQLFLASIAWIGGVRIDSLDMNFINIGSFELPIILSFLLTVLWISSVINAINWFDGLDGLAAGTTVIIGLSIFLAALFTGNTLIGFLACVLVGSCLGFLRLNLYPSKILMGDGGSYFLGYLLSIISIYGVTTKVNNPNIVFGFFFLIIPILDMVFVIFSRIKDGCSPYFPDRRHLHHRILNRGFDHKNTVKLILNLVLISSTTLLVCFTNNFISKILFSVSIILITIFFAINKKKLFKRKLSNAQFK